MAQLHACNVPTGHIMCTGRFVVCAHAMFTVHVWGMSGMTTRFFRSIHNSHIHHASPLCILRAFADRVVFCADTLMTHTCGEDA